MNGTKPGNRSILILGQKSKDLCWKIKYCIEQLSLDSENYFKKKEKREKRCESHRTHVVWLKVTPRDSEGNERTTCRHPQTDTPQSLAQLFESCSVLQMLVASGTQHSWNRHKL